MYILSNIVLEDYYIVHFQNVSNSFRERYHAVSCRGLCLNYLNKISQMWGPIQVVFYNKLSWLVSELPEKDISNVV